MTLGKVEDKRGTLGILGEKIVAKYLRSLGRNVDESLDMFDSVKDMEVDGKKVEVKTQVPFFKKDSFTIRENQLKKCVESDELYIVQVPTDDKSKVGSDAGDGWIHYVEGKNLIYNAYTTKDGRKMYLLPRVQFKRVYQVTDKKILSQLTELTSSRY